MNLAWVGLTSIFVLAASCYILYQLSDLLEQVGSRLGKLLRLPEAVIASTLQAAATSGPEIVMAILAATAFISTGWGSLEMGEKASSGTLNMAFSAIDNLLGIGCLGIIFMIKRGTLDPDEIIKLKPSTYISLGFYFVASSLFFAFVSNGVLSQTEGWILAITGVWYVTVQVLLPYVTARLPVLQEENEDDEDEEEEPLPTTTQAYFRELFTNGFAYCFLVFALIVFVRECLSSTFNLGTLGIVSVGGILLALTSYVSSFPEFCLTFRYAMADKKTALLGMLFGSNIIDLAFGGFRSIWLAEDTAIFTTGVMPGLLPYYIAALPVIACLALIFIGSGRVRYRIAYPCVIFYCLYIVSGFILL
jgi:Ca2+/Na+ antiporter